jgi:hypothetical protein
LQDPGRGRGFFVHPPEKIFSSPPAYAFALPNSGTHPLKFDPSYWMEGVRPRFVLRRQIATLLANFLKNQELLIALAMAVLLVLTFGYCLRRRLDVSMLRCTWSMCLIGFAGCVMYAMVHVEARYVGAFLVLFWCGILFSLRIPRRVSGKVVTVITLVVVAFSLLPMASLVYVKHSRGMGKINTAALVAAEIERVGVQAGDPVATISQRGKGAGLGVERIARIMVAAGVDLDRGDEFWSLSVQQQQDLLHIFAARGVKAVIAVSPRLDPSNQSEWTHLGSTQYWIWWPKS